MPHLDSLTPIKCTTSKLLACAVSELFPHTLMVEGAATGTGFYYDFVFKEPLETKALIFLEERMHALIREGLKIQVLDMMRDNAKELFRHRHQKIQGSLVTSSTEQIVQVCKIGDFYDYCPQEISLDLKQAKAFKLISIRSETHYSEKSGALSVTRIEGIQGEHSLKLKELAKLLETTKKNDHKTWGKKLDLFSFPEKIGKGICLWLPKGQTVKNSLLKLTNLDNQYTPISTPPIVLSELLEKTLTKQAFTLKQQSLSYSSFVSPNLLHCLLFSEQKPLAVDLPIKYCEIKENVSLSNLNEINGLLEGHVNTQDFESLFCVETEIQNHIISSLHFIEKTINMYGFEHHWYLAIPDKGSKASKSVGKASDWFVKAFEACGIESFRKTTETDVYGPTVFVCLVDSVGKEWKCSSLGIDLFHPEFLGLSVEGPDGNKHRPWLLSRSMFCSLERTIALLIEKYAGDFPLFLNQLQMTLKENII